MRITAAGRHPVIERNSAEIPPIHEVRWGAYPKPPDRYPHRVWRPATLAIAGCLLSTEPALAQLGTDRSVLLGGPVRVQVADVSPDTRLRGGTAVAPELARPSDRREPAACSSSAPVCVHRGAASADDALAALEALETAYRKLVFAMRLPAPLDDWTQGGSGALDLYLDASTTQAFVSEHTDVIDDPFDSAPAFCVAAPARGVVLERVATQCVGEAIAWRLDPAETPSLRRAFATTLWWEIGRPTLTDSEAIARVQAEPERALIGQTLSDRSEGDALLLAFIDLKHGAGGPGVLPTALVSASAQTTPASEAFWRNEPDVFDVMRHTFGPSLGGVAALLRDLAVTRAFIGDRDDGSHLPSLRWMGSHAAPRIDWTVAASSLPRNLACARNVEPTGSVYVRVDLDRWDPKATLGLRASWESHAAFAWTVVRLDSSGHEVGRLDVPFAEGESTAEARVVQFDHTAALLFVGTNAGGLGKTDAFDPDLPVEPSGCELYLARL